MAIAKSEHHSLARKDPAHLTSVVAMLPHSSLLLPNCHHATHQCFKKMGPSALPKRPRLCAMATPPYDPAYAPTHLPSSSQ